MKERKNIWKGMMVGAALGAAFSFLMGKKEEKQERFSWPMRLKQWRQSAEEMAEDAAFIMEKLKEIAEKTPEVIQLVKELYNWKENDRPRIK
jgi:gas vesicle protein